MKLALALSTLLAATAANVSAQNIVEVASGNENFATLVDLVVQAELADTLATTNDITVFAPVNDAFGALPTEVVSNLMTDPWKPHLQDVLSYHVVPSVVPASAIIGAAPDAVEAEMLNTETISAQFDGTSVIINDSATVIDPDLQADNGLIHVVDNVLLPSWVSNSIVDRAVASEDLATLVQLVTQAQLVETLSTGGPFTVFAPTNAAFTEAIAVVTERLGSDALDPALISTLLTYHVVEGIYPSSAIADGLELTTVEGRPITFSLEGDAASVSGAGIAIPDILANNGIVHVIDAVMIPPGALPDAPAMGDDMGTTTDAPMDPTEAPMDPTDAPMDPTAAPSSASSRFVGGVVAVMAAASYLVL